MSAIRVNFNNKSEILAEGYTAGSAASRVRTFASAVAVGAFARRLVHIIVVVVGSNIVRPCNFLLVFVRHGGAVVGIFSAARKANGAACGKNCNKLQNRLFHKTSMHIFKKLIHILEKNPRK